MNRHPRALQAPGWRFIGGNLVPPSFRAASRPPVRGGRWSVRRDPTVPNRPWRAWTRGKGGSFSRRFATHAEAIQHATTVAQVFANPTHENVRNAMRAIYPNISQDRVEWYVNRFFAVSGNTKTPGPTGSVHPEEGSTT